MLWWNFNENMMTSSNGNIFRVTGHLCGEFPAKGQWRRALIFSLICAWINGWVNNGEAGDLRRHRAHYDLTGIMRQSLRQLIWKYRLPMAITGKMHNGRNKGTVVYFMIINYGRQLFSIKDLGCSPCTICICVCNTSHQQSKCHMNTLSLYPS